MQGIYKIVNKVDGKFYVGSSSDLDGRRRNHFGNLRNGSHRNKYLQAAFNKYGEDNFEFIIVEETDSLSKEELLVTEQRYLDNLSREVAYNLTYTAGGGGSDTLEIPTYVLNLDYKIVYETDSIQKAAIYTTGKTSQISRINCGGIVNYEYIIVTKEFYNTHPEEIIKWKEKTSKLREKRLNKIFNRIKWEEDKKILIDFEDTTLEFPSMAEVSRFLGMSRQLVEHRLKGVAKMDKFNIRYKSKSCKKVFKKFIVARIDDKEIRFDSMEEAAKYLGTNADTIKYNLEGYYTRKKYDVKYRTIN